MASVDHSRKGSMKQRALKKLWGPSNMQLRVYIAKWLINDGLPYNTVTTESFRSLMEVAAGKPDVRLLEMEYTSAYKRPFLNLMHDIWTAGTEKKDVIGTSMSFIDKD
ncbi:hypothetical protein F442_23066 [Phytophthora nicotianae P10297]|uniref:Uncharacterized protein n=1 Tax=Phytophthora nicotianae P10297 TaxID=1317064 RepID=W2XZ34_PHYNI|nr:hypothetical protein F442_23066 [Phytophthora nicotianae P10297]